MIKEPAIDGPRYVPPRPELYKSGDLEKFCGCFADHLNTEHPIDMAVTREERILIVRRRAGLSNAALCYKLAAAGELICSSTLYAALNRASLNRISEATRERVLRAVEEVLEVDDDLPPDYPPMSEDIKGWPDVASGDNGEE